LWRCVASRAFADVDPYASAFGPAVVGGGGGTSSNGGAAAAAGVGPEAGGGGAEVAPAAFDQTQDSDADLVNV
jgi:hypothetical protein